MRLDRASVTLSPRNSLVEGPIEGDSSDVREPRPFVPGWSASPCTLRYWVHRSCEGSPAATRTRAAQRRTSTTRGIRAWLMQRILFVRRCPLRGCSSAPSRAAASPQSSNSSARVDLSGQPRLMRIDARAIAKAVEHQRAA